MKVPPTYISSLAPGYGIPFPTGKRAPEIHDKSPPTMRENGRDLSGWLVAVLSSYPTEYPAPNEASL